MTHRLPLVSILAVLAACSSASSSPPDGPPPAPQARLATDIAISEIALFQGLKVPLMKDGTTIDGRSTPIVVGRDGMLRVYIAPSATWQPRQVVVRLEIHDPADKTPRAPLEIGGKLEVASTEESLSSTANFAVPGEAITAGARFSVSILEASPTVSIAGDSSAARWPAKADQAILAERTNDAFKIVLVPIQYDGDGSARMPDTGPATVERLRARMLALYPTPRVDISVGDPLAYPKPISPVSGSDWSHLLQAVLARRQASNAPADVYYYGLVTPTDSELSFCGGGCIAGLTSSVVSGASVPELRGSVGIGYPGDDALTTFVHETGHAQNLRHASCSELGPILNVDPAFPYGAGEIGVWGYDAGAGKLLAPTAAKDIMGYCQPTWISDYHYAHLAAEMRFVGGAMYTIGAADFPDRWQVIGVDEQGHGTLGVELDVQSIPTGETRAVKVVRSGVTETVKGYFHAFADVGGGLLFVPLRREARPDGYFLEGAVAGAKWERVGRAR